MRITLAAVALFIASCGGGGDDPPAGVAVADFCAGWSDALCASAARCACILEPADCMAESADRCLLAEGRPTREAVDAGSLPYDAVSAARLIESLRALPCDQRPTQCGTSDACLGLGIAGESCGTTRGCTAELICLGGVCTAPGPEGAACEDSAACLSGRCAAGACAPAGELGTVCSEDSACASGNCDFATERCREKEPLEALCTDDSQCESGYCDRVELASGNCRERQPLGAECDEDAMCIDGACLDGLCGPAFCDDLIP